MRAAGSPVLLALLLGQLGWSGYRGLREGWRHWRATRAALDYLGAGGLSEPEPAAALAAACADLGLAGRVTVVATNTPLAFCAGLWRPRIWLSRGALAVLGPAELRAVLSHERAHQRRRDPLQLLVARSCVAALPHLPVVRELAAALPLAHELAADRAVIRAGAGAALGRALLALTVPGSEAVGSEAMAPTLATGMLTCLDARIDQLTGAHVAAPRLSRRALLRTGGVLCGGLLLLITLLASNPGAPPGLPPGPPSQGHLVAGGWANPVVPSDAAPGPGPSRLQGSGTAQP